MSPYDSLFTGNHLLSRAQLQLVLMHIPLRLSMPECHPAIWSHNLQRQLKPSLQGAYNALKLLATLDACLLTRTVYAFQRS